MSKEQLYDVIRSPLITEKTTLAGEYNKVAFEVSSTATKPVVKKAIEAIFKVKVAKVNIINAQGKTKRFRGRIGKRSDVKKAIVTLAEGQQIDVTSGV